MKGAWRGQVDKIEQQHVPYAEGCDVSGCWGGLYVCDPQCSHEMVANGASSTWGLAVSVHM